MKGVDGNPDVYASVVGGDPESGYYFVIWDRSGTLHVMDSGTWDRASVTLSRDDAKRIGQRMVEWANGDEEE